jgi:hypothetical protein
LVLEKTTIMKPKELETFVNNYPTKHQEGFTPYEMNALVEELSLDKETFHDKLGINTGMIIDGDFITYHCDVYKGAICTIENRDQRLEEWD